MHTSQENIQPLIFHKTILNMNQIKLKITIYTHTLKHRQII
jgi:hypothetical protein